MGVQYLVDYENVHEAGIYGMETLTAEDNVYIFHTSQNDKISLSRLDNVKAWVKVILVPPGKQSLDMHLGSFLGFLIGKEDADTKFAIVSHDMDYRGIADFWNDTYQTKEKVYCIHGILSSFGNANPDAYLSIPADYSAARHAVHDFIIRTFSKYAVTNMNGIPCMLVSELCTRLNNLMEYRFEKQRLGMKPMQYLMEECKDIVWVWKQNNRDWVFLQTRENENSSVEADTTDPEETEPAVIIMEETETEEDIPDIMEIGDLNIDDEPILQQAADKAGQETVSDLEEAAPDTEEVPSDRADLLTAALHCLRKAEGTERNENGHNRASFLRDELMRFPDFRTSLSESGMKPIAFLQQLFPDSIRIYREKGIWWAEDIREDSNKGRDESLEDRRKAFQAAAFNNIRDRLSGAGLDQCVADEIAGICMRTDSESEQRKTIHMLLCQRFGNRIGSKYYRRAVKYISA